MKFPGFLNRSRFVTSLSDVGHIEDGSTSNIAEYDFIIVGGGTAGCVLASRLSENPSFRILVLESGGSGKSLLFSRIPSTFSFLFHTKHVYELHTEPQKFAHEKTKYWPRGRMLGGCSSINAQMAQYGSPHDFDEWGRIIGDDSWSWKHFNRYFRKFEKYVPNAEYPDVDSSKKGSEGPVQVGYFTTVTQPSQDFVTACTELGIPFSSDFNTSDGTKGVSRIMTYIDKNATRVSSETAYLTEEVLARPNLVVALHAHVTKILFDKTPNGDIRAVGVEFCNSKEGPHYRALARKEVLLSAGAVHSPQILMLSGVGPVSHLKDVGIPVIHDLPGVGSHLLDHAVVDLNFKDKLNASTKYINPHSVGEAFKAIGAVLQYFLTGKGPVASNMGESVAFVRSDDPLLFTHSGSPVENPDNLQALDRPDLEIFTTPFSYKDHGVYILPVHSFGLHAVLLRPNSNGSIRLKSDSSWDNPIMDPRYLEAPEDIRRLVLGMKLVLKIAKAGPLASRLDHEDKNPLLDHDMHLKSDEELEEIIRERVETLYHPTSTCRMAPLQEGGVVDSRLRVHGIQGLRICDASIYPTIVSGHTTGAVYAVAEKLSDILKEDYTPKTTEMNINNDS